MNKDKHTGRDHHTQGTGRGPSSFWMHDSNLVFHALALKPGDAFLDLGCGPGDYAMTAARIVGPSGTVLAFDKWPYLIDGLKDEAACLGLDNIQAVRGDITQALPMADHCIDCCMLATVLHIFGLPIARKTLFREAQRVLKPSGRLAIIESKKEDQPFGPPLEARISPGELEASLHPLGYRKINYREFEYTYLIQFDVTGKTH